MGVDFDELATIFNQWAQASVKLENSQWCGIDGKSIKGTVKNSQSKSQNFVSIVSVFAHQRGRVMGLAQLANQQTSEIATVQNLMTVLELQGVVFSLYQIRFLQTTFLS